MRIFTVASAELISKPVSLVSMVRTGEEEQEFLTEGLQDLTGNARQTTELGSGAAAPGRAPTPSAEAQAASQQPVSATTPSDPGERPTFAGVLRPQAFHDFVSQGCHSFHWGEEAEEGVGAGPSATVQSAAAQLILTGG